MFKLLTMARAASAGALLLPVAAVASGHHVRDQSDLDLSGRKAITSAVAAVDLTLPSSLRLTSLVVFLSDGAGGSENGALDCLEGPLSWAFYEDDSGGPHSGDPDILSGEDPAPVVTDTGLNDSSGGDLAAVRIDFSPAFSLEGGPYWLAIHEGSWGSAGTGCELWWQEASTVVGAAAYVASDEVSPVWSVATGEELAFVLHAVPPAWSEWDVSLAAAADLSYLVAANDFVLSESTRLSTLDLPLGDSTPGLNGALDSFSGSVSWAIYSHDVGDDEPAAGTPLHQGHDASPRLMDSGLPTGLDTDAFQVRVTLDSRPQLPAGTYWLAIHEGAWGAEYDGSIVYWLANESVVGTAGRTSSSLSTPGPDWDLETDDGSFVFFDELLFGSGFEAGVTCAWASTQGGSLCP